MLAFPSEPAILPLLDEPGRREIATVNVNREKMSPHLEAEIFSFAGKIAHHGVENFVEAVRQRCGVNLTREYAANLLMEQTK